MKKLIALTLVLGLASVANGAIVLSVNGVTGTAADEIWLAPSDWIVLNIELDGVAINGGDLQIQLSNSQGILDPSGITFPTPTLRWWRNIELPSIPLSIHSWTDSTLALGAPYAVVGAQTNAQQVTISGGDLQWNTSTTGPMTLMDDLLFHCEESTDLVISLVAPLGLTAMVYGPDPTSPTWGLPNVTGTTQVYAPGAVLDTIIVHQIPEPMTVALLGLGGLGLLRRRRK